MQRNIANDFTTIRIPRSLSARAKKRAKELGLSTIGEYITSLIWKDLTTEARRRNEKSPEYAPTHDAVLHSVKPFAKAKRGKSPVALRKDVLDGMFSYMKASEDPGFGYACGYQLKHVHRCATITRDFLDRLSSPPKRKTPAQLLEVVRGVVIKLNKLNASCGRAIITTDQREVLCQFIMSAANNAGLKIDRDITEQWRGW
jgi:hypothetical protein